METGRWYPENYGEKVNETIATAAMGVVAAVLSIMVVWGIIIGF